MSQENTKPISFLAFFLLWAKRQGWKVPMIHVVACHWLEHRGDLAVMRCFRGFSKSTILGVYNAWLYYCDPSYKILHQGDQDGTALKTSRDTKSILQRHPLTAHLCPIRGESSFWWIQGANDERNPSMQAAGIMSNITSSRAHEAQNDDVEVPRNIKTPEARELLRYRLGEQTHILLPNGRKLFVGTPHTHDSLYDEQEKMGADCLTIRMFEKEQRIVFADGKKYTVGFKPEFVFTGIYKSAELLKEGTHYDLTDIGDSWQIEFIKPPSCLVDIYGEAAWIERFNRSELFKRRKETRTIGEWDSQYQLHSKPIEDSRLDPSRIKAYDVHPTIETANRHSRMTLGRVRIESARAYWDCALGKVGGDDSAFSLVLDDAAGNYYWHRCVKLDGDFAEFSDTRNSAIIGGQVMQVCDEIERFNIPQVVVESNGVGAFVPQLLRQAIKQRGLKCGVVAQNRSENKNKYIIAGLEPPLSSGVLWAHIDVLDGEMPEQMRSFNPATNKNKDDFLDSGAGAILAAPVRIGANFKAPENEREGWRSHSETYIAETDFHH